MAGPELRSALVERNARASATGTPSDRHGRGLRLVVGLLALGAAVTYSVWLLEFALPTHLSPLASFVSEHYVVSQPYQRLFRSADVIAGALYLAAAVALGHLLPRGWPSMGVALGLGVFGATTITDAVFVPDCVATVDSACERREFTGHVSWQHLLHLGSSAVSQIAIIAAVLALERLATQRGTPTDRWLARVILAVLVIAGLACVAFYQVGWVGIPQRVQLIAITCATVAGAARVVSSGHADPGAHHGRSPTKPDQDVRPPLAGSAF